MLLKQNIEFNKKERTDLKNELKLNTENTKHTTSNSKFQNESSSYSRNLLNHSLNSNNFNTDQKSDFRKDYSKNREEIKVGDANSKFERKELKSDNSEHTRININSLSYEREDVTNVKAYTKPLLNNVKVIFIGISTGGPAALQKIIPSLSNKINVPIFIVQHMPPNFTKSLSVRLDSVCKLNIKEAEHNEVIQPGTIYIGKGGSQMLVDNKGLVKLEEKKYENNLFAPSVEVTLDSLIDAYGGKILGFMMTGMGNDGKNAFKRLKQKNGFIVVQDFHSCVVAGMPKSVVDTGSAMEVVKLDDIPQYINSIFD